ncbi:MAG: ribonuclease domain-containing protein [Dehalococcoidia bacterium]
MSDARQHSDANRDPAATTVHRASEPRARTDGALFDEDAFAARLGTVALAGADQTLPPPNLTQRTFASLQRFAGNRAVARLVAPSSSLQRAVYKEGGKGAVAIPAAARTIKAWVTKPSVQPGGRNHIADVQNRGFPGFKKGKEEFAGGRTFNNNAQPDGNKLPYSGGQTYQEWDITPCVLGQNRGGERIITGSDGKAYYTGDHYANFTEF